ncbi:Alcohol dehydrogenase-like 5 [Linum perenne]
MLPPILLHNYETQTIQLQNQYKLHYKNQISKLPLHTLFPTLIPPNSSMAITTAGKVIRCKAAICRNPGEDLVLEEIEVDPPKAFEVRLRILCTSLCHSDVTFWNMKPGPISVFPRILGHEAVGMVESVGEGVEGWEEGEVGLPVFIPDCEECRDCKSAKSNICSKFGNTTAGLGMARDGTSRFRDGRGDSVHHFLGVSSFSEYTVVDVINLVKIGFDFPLDKACLLSCGVSTGVGAAWKAAEVEKGSTVAIFGLGAVGLAVAEGARIRGASKIIGVDLNPAKFELGKKFGLTDFINPKINMNNMAQVIKEMTDGGADYCFECIGLASLMTDAFSSSREGWGKTVIVGIEMHGSPLLVNPYELVRGRSISGTYFGGLKPRTDISILAKKYLDKELNLETFITHEVGFKDINKAFKLLVEGKSLRCLIWMDDAAK